MHKTLVALEAITKDYINEEVATKVLQGVSLSIEAGEFVAIMGPSGSGKSTLMHILGFLDRPTTGKYLFEGRDTTTFDDEELAALRNQKIGFVFQAFNLLPRTTVIENVRLPLMYSQKKDHTSLSKKALDAVGLSHRLDFYTNQISGGEKQRVAIARALVTDPAIIFADEPTGNLDSKSGNTVMQILQNLNDEGRTIILVTHENETAEHAKRLIKIRDGEIISDSSITHRKIAKASGDLVK